MNTKNETMVKKAVNNILAKEIKKWPPPCAGIFYQPQRPKMPKCEK